MKRCIICGNLGKDDSTVCDVCGNPYLDLEDDPYLEEAAASEEGFSQDWDRGNTDTRGVEKMEKEPEMQQEAVREPEVRNTQKAVCEPEVQNTQEAVRSSEGQNVQEEAASGARRTGASAREAVREEIRAAAAEAAASAQRKEAPEESPVLDRSDSRMKSGPKIYGQEAERSVRERRGPEGTLRRETVGQTRRPAGAGAQAGMRPANGQGRPVNAQGSAARPANGQGRPVNAQGSAARPANGQGRPVNAQGSAARPANGQGRPVNAQGSAARPANGQGRPVNAQGSAARPANGQGRPMNAQGSPARPMNGQGRPVNAQGSPVRPMNGQGRPMNAQGGPAYPMNGPGRMTGMPNGRLRTEARKALGSPILLLVAILQTVSLIGSVAAIFMKELNFSQILRLITSAPLPSQLMGYTDKLLNLMAKLDTDAVAVNLVMKLPDLLLCIGLWAVVMAAKSRRDEMSATGFVFMKAVVVIGLVKNSVLMLGGLVISVALTVSAWVSHAPSMIAAAVITLVLMIAVTMMMVMYYFSYLATLRTFQVNAVEGESYGEASPYVAVVLALIGLTGIVGLLSGIVNVEISNIVASIGKIGWMVLFAVWIFQYRAKMSEIEN